MPPIVLKVFSCFIAVIFAFQTILSSTGYGQNIALRQASVQVGLSESFHPVTAKGLRINPNEALNMSFIIDSGDETSPEAIKVQSEKLIKYFLSALTIPEKDLWVNLSPYEKDRITTDTLGKTEMGRDLLALDYLLKEMTSSLLNPEDEIGQAFWDKVQSQVYEKFGTTDLPIESLNKVWIMPDKVELFAQGDKVLILNSRMKVMLEGDYLATEIYNSKKDSVGNKSADPVVTDDVKQILRDVIIPVLEEEVNHGEHFAQLRQIFHALILAKWFKDNLKESILTRVYADQNKIQGVEHNTEGVIENIYQQYVAAFQRGAEGIIKEDYDPQSQEMTARKYITGGVAGQFEEKTFAMLNAADAQQEFEVEGDAYELAFDLNTKDGRVENLRNALSNQGLSEEAIEAEVRRQYPGVEINDVEEDAAMLFSQGRRDILKLLGLTAAGTIVNPPNIFASVVRYFLKERTIKADLIQKLNELSLGVLNENFIVFMPFDDRRYANGGPTIEEMVQYYREAIKSTQTSAIDVRTSQGNVHVILGMHAIGGNLGRVLKDILDGLNSGKIPPSVLEEKIPGILDAQSRLLRSFKEQMKLIEKWEIGKENISPFFVEDTTTYKVVEAYFDIWFSFEVDPYLLKKLMKQLMPKLSNDQLDDYLLLMLGPIGFSVMNNKIKSHPIFGVDHTDLKNKYFATEKDLQTALEGAVNALKEYPSDFDRNVEKIQAIINYSLSQYESYFTEDYFKEMGVSDDFRSHWERLGRIVEQQIGVIKERDDQMLKIEERYLYWLNGDQNMLDGLQKVGALHGVGLPQASARLKPFNIDDISPEEAISDMDNIGMNALQYARQAQIFLKNRNVFSHISNDIIRDKLNAALSLHRIVKGNFEKFLTLEKFNGEQLIIKDNLLFIDIEIEKIEGLLKTVDKAMMTRRDFLDNLGTLGFWGIVLALFGACNRTKENSGSSTPTPSSTDAKAAPIIPDINEGLRKKIEEVSRKYGYGSAVVQYLSRGNQPWNNIAGFESKSVEQKSVALAEAIKSVVTYDVDHFRESMASVNQTIYANDVFNKIGELERLVQTNKAICNGFSAAFVILAESHGIEAYVYAAQTGQSGYGWDHAINIIRLPSGESMLLDLSHNVLVYSVPFSFNNTYRSAKDGEIEYFQITGNLQLLGNPNLRSWYSKIALAVPENYYINLANFLKNFEDILVFFPSAQKFHQQANDINNKGPGHFQEAKPIFEEAVRYYKRSLEIANRVLSLEKIYVQDIFRQTESGVQKWNDFKGVKASAENNLRMIRDLFEANGESVSDFAMIADRKTTGGIDFDTSDMTTKTSGKGLDIQIKNNLGDVDPAMIQGLIPVNIRLMPITDIGVLFGKADSGGNESSDSQKMSLDVAMKFEDIS